MKQKKPSKVYTLKTKASSSAWAISQRGAFQCIEYIYFTTTSEERADELMSELFDKISNSVKKYTEPALKFREYKSALMEKAMLDLREADLRGFSEAARQKRVAKYVDAENLQAKDFLSPEEYELYNIPIWSYKTLWDWSNRSDEDKATVIKYWRDNYLQYYLLDVLEDCSRVVADIRNLPVIRREKPVEQLPNIYRRCR